MSEAAWDADRVRLLIDDSMDLIADGNAAEAQARAEEAADVLDRASDDAARVDELLERLADLFGDIGAFDTARAARDRALTIQRRRFGSTSLPVAEGLSALADLCCAHHRLDDTSAYLAEAASVFEALRCHEQVAQTLQNLASVRLQLNDVDDAHALAKKAIQIYAALGSDKHASDIAVCKEIVSSMR